MPKSRPPKPASQIANDSIWTLVDRNVFYKNAQSLLAIRKCPGEPTEYAVSNYEIPESTNDSYLPFNLERKLADHFAFIASAEKDAQKVCAAAIESTADGLTVSLACNGPMPRQTEAMVTMILQELETCAKRRLSRDACETRLFDLLVKAHLQRILGKLESIHWIPPPHVTRRLDFKREPLHEKLRLVVDEPGHLPLRLRNLMITLHRQCADIDKLGLASTIEDSLGPLLTSCYRIYRELPRGWRAAKVLQPSVLRKILKLAQYWRIAKALTMASRKQMRQFQSLKLHVPRFPDQSLPMNVGLTLHVHAEVQLLAFHDEQKPHNPPRAIGLSKGACYLCNLWLKSHGGMFFRRTHGKLYEKWAVPVIPSGPDKEQQRSRYRRMLQSVDGDVRKELNRCRQRRARKDLPFPPESVVTSIPSADPSPYASDVSTIISLLSSSSGDTVMNCGAEEQPQSPGIEDRNSALLQSHHIQAEQGESPSSRASEQPRTVSSPTGSKSINNSAPGPDCRENPHCEEASKSTLEKSHGSHTLLDDAITSAQIITLAPLKLKDTGIKVRFSFEIEPGATGHILATRLQTGHRLSSESERSSGPEHLHSFGELAALPLDGRTLEKADDGKEVALVFDDEGDRVDRKAVLVVRLTWD